ncbi:B12-binding domain-containing radical SAM protein [Dehalogenimonas alkenigignens]|uniref:Fe-S oxidoreductase n=1 Tax=Dehalogenimonas alkenigignens TaxID=1217799 RepID=A0A0W0GH58_9CHLR|nr:radical SAM protein [Dehalogenimonas alkenigignens]KTB47887.1 Fe-S oxidoreductase [Dehalogenimonas alkenigignens]PVV83918.1 radical SAM protein [Dehalogenimonas alkenigignens]
MRVLLVNPGSEVNPRFNTYAVFPNGLLFLAAVLERAGHEVKVYDNVVDRRKPVDFKDFDPQLIGYSVLTGPDITQAILQSKEFKALYPEARIVWGNVHPSCTPEQTMAEEYIDYVIVGAGETALLQLIDYIEKGSTQPAAIAGLVYRENGQLKMNERASELKNLDELPDPAWHLIDVPKYWQVSLNTSRGCPFRCTFCYNSAFHSGYRGDFSAERIVAQVEHLQQRYGVKFIRFFEDNFTFNRKRLHRFCELVIEKKIKLKWDCEARADLSEKDVDLMARAGCVSVGIGVETGSKRLLEFLKKDIDLDVMQKSFWNIVRHRIMPRIYIMEAVPTETLADYQATRDLLHKMGDTPYFYMRFVPYPGTPIYYYCIEKGLIKPPEKLADWPHFSFNLATRGNLSEVPTEVVTEAFAEYARTYGPRRVRFMWRYNKRFFLSMVKNPLQFFGAVKELIKNTLPVMFNKNTSEAPEIKVEDIRTKKLAETQSEARK